MDDLIEEVKKLDNELYKATYVENDYEKKQKIWNNIKGNHKILEMATSIVKNKHYEKDTFLASAIVECMLIDYNQPKEDTNQLSMFEGYSAYNDLYQKLVDKIYSNVELARIVLDGYSNGGNSFLLYTLFNDNLELTDEQKAFALEEAMHKIGTTKYGMIMEYYARKLDEKGITDDLTVTVPEIGPIGAKTWNTYMADRFASINTSQAHGTGEFDIRYHILKNHNFADQIEKLVYDFYQDNEVFAETVDYWEWDIVNLCHKDDSDEPVIYVDELLFINEEEVNARLPHEQAKKVIEEINFIKRLHEIRPAQLELDSTPPQKVFI